MVYVRSFLVGLLIMMSATIWAKDYTTTALAASFQGPQIQVLPQTQTGIYRLAVLAGEAQDFTVRILDKDRVELYRERVKNTEQFTKRFSFAESPYGTYIILVEGKKWRLREEIAYEESNLPVLDMSLIQTQDSRRVLLHVDGVDSEEVLVRIKNSTGRVIFDEYVALNEGGLRSFDLSQVPSGRLYFDVSKGTITKEEMIFLR